MRSRRRSTSWRSRGSVSGPWSSASCKRVAVAEAAFGDQGVLDEAPGLVRHVGHAALVEVADDGVAGLLEQRGVDGGLAACLALFVEAVAHQAEQRGFDLQLVPRLLARPCGVRVPRPVLSSPRLHRGDEANDLPGRLVAHQLVGSTRGRLPAHDLQRPVGAHGQQAQPVAHERRQLALPAFHLGQEVLAEAEQHLVALAAQIQVLRRLACPRCAAPERPECGSRSGRRGPAGAARYRRRSPRPA